MSSCTRGRFAVFCRGVEPNALICLRNDSGFAFVLAVWVDAELVRDLALLVLTQSVMFSDEKTELESSSN